MTLSYAITFEYANDAPRTIRGTTSASTVRACIGRSVNKAMADPSTKKTRWSSMVILVEKVDDTMD